ncbi:hypothetical protein [Burkholderia glumae]|uniref:hypothetical protein n=1 Tax=Burkholderia glumae TaxID=337 RepID=UPI002151A77D|nr:hypothetical protein [Burkholderia glumae]UVS99287.1 hypothetical protein EFP19_27295 [Burkholderia glumae]
MLRAAKATRASFFYRTGEMPVVEAQRPATGGSGEDARPAHYRGLSIERRSAVLAALGTPPAALRIDPLGRLAHLRPMAASGLPAAMRERCRLAAGGA